MKNIAKNTLGYTGIVTLSQYNGAKKVKLAQLHNKGGNPLFNFLSDCLIGDFDVAKTRRPEKIMLLNYDEQTQTHSKASAGFVHLVSKPEKVYSASAGIVRYSFIITRDILESASSFNRLGLYTNAATDQDLEDFAAYCDIDILGSSISASSVLVVDWELVISNRD